MNKYLLLGAALAVLGSHQSKAGTVSQTDPQAGGIGYRWTVDLGEIDSVTFTRHVGAWSWEDNELFSPGDDPVGWTHTSDWVALTLLQPTTLTVRLERQAGVPWPSPADPGRTASIASMFPSFTMWSGWDNDLMLPEISQALGYGTEGNDHHTYNNDGLVNWAEDLTGVVGFVNNSTDTFAEATYTLPAGQYSVVLGSNAPATDPTRQGYRATFTAVPEPSTALTLLSGVGVLALRRRRAFRSFAGVAMGLSLVAQSDVQAHISYTNRNFGSFDGSDASVTITNQTVSGAFGWADGTDADFTDSHRLRAFRFNLANPLTLTITVESIAFGTAIGGLLPGFSIYSGLAHLPPAQLDHDGAQISVDYLATLPGPAKEGALRSLDDWKIGSDSGVTFADLSEFIFRDYAVDGTAANFGSAPGITGDGFADGVVSKTFSLPAGDYTLFVGGADYAAGEGATAPFTNYGVRTTLAVPEPTTALTLLSGVGVLALRRRRVC